MKKTPEKNCKLRVQNTIEINTVVDLVLMCSKTKHYFKKIKFVITIVKKLKYVHTILTDDIELPSTLGISYKRYNKAIVFDNQF